MAIFVFCILTAISFQEPQLLKQKDFGIIPLQSTRADVVRRYGSSHDSCGCIFRTKTETITIALASSPCAGALYGWNVPKDTVLSFTVTPYATPRLSETVFDLNALAKHYSPDDGATTYYTNIEKGMSISVQDDRVISVTYYPPSSENKKRCQGFPAWNGVPAPTPFAIIMGTFNRDSETVLDNLAVELEMNPRMLGYIIAYGGKKARREEAKEMAETARQYLIKRRMIASERIIALDGGFRETAQYELFSLSAQMAPPTPTPTVPSNKVQIVGGKTRRYGRSPRQ